MLKADGLDDAVIGKTYDMAVQEDRLVYSVQKCIKVFVDRDGMTYEEAREFLEFNTLCAYVDKTQPIFVDAEIFDTIEDLF
jgi:hypothetical protein